MKTKSIACIILVLLLLLSSLCAFAQDEVFDVNLSDNGSVNIIYCYPYYRNSQISVVFTEISTGDTVYCQQYELSNTGLLRLNNIKLPKSGEYTITVFPKNRASSLYSSITYFTDADKLSLWIVASTATDSTELSDNWHYINSILGIDVPLLSYVKNIDVFYDKSASNREGDLSEKNDENFKALTAYFSEMAYFTALEQNSSKDVLNKLLAMADSEAMSDAGFDYDSWSSVASDGKYNILLDIFAKKEKSLASYSDLSIVMKSALNDYEVKELLDSITKAVHVSDVNLILSNKENAQKLGVSDLYDSYNSLDDTTSADKALMRIIFDNAADFRKVFSEAVTNALKEQAENNKKPTSVPQYGSSSGGGGFYGSSGGGNASVMPKVPEDISKPFNDLSDFAWAEEHINKLYTLGIISGKGQNVFAPADCITREEIAKLAVSLFKLENKGDDISFSDVVPGLWYEQYVNIAASNGIVRGIGNNMFGTGLAAKRQDIALMLVNAIEAYGYFCDKSQKAPFADREEISSYAVSAADALFTAGVITGDEFNCFNPSDNATRAEVAVMISRIYEIFVKER